MPSAQPIIIASERPIIIAGCPRSGTTLLTTMLHAHPRLAVPPETRFLIPGYRNRAAFGDLRLADNRRALARAITGKGTKFRDLGLKRADVVERIVAAEPTYGTAAGTIWRTFAHSRGKARWGEKRPSYWRDMDVVLRLFPTAQVVHLVRDGRACVASLLRQKWWGRSPVASMTEWVLADQTLRRVGSRLPPDRYLRLRYEDLLADPARELQALCASLGEDYDEGMLEYARAAADIVPDRKVWHAGTKAELDPQRIDAWRGDLDDDQLGLFEAVAARSLRANGYELSGEGHRPSLAARARFTAVLDGRRAAALQRRARDARQRRRDDVPLADAGE